MRLAGPASRGRLERDRHGSHNRTADDSDPDTPTGADADSPSASRHRPQRYLVGIVWDRPGPGAERRHRPWIRALLYGRHRRRGLAPIAYGVIADHSNRTVGIVAAALTACVTIPLILALRPILEKEFILVAHSPPSE